MSVVADQIRHLEAQLDRIPLLSGLTDGESDGQVLLSATEASEAFSSPRVNELLRIVKALSTTSSSNSLLQSWRIQLLLSQSGLAVPPSQHEDQKHSNKYESEIEWLLVSKATIQTYGILMNTLLDQIIPLSDDIWYWDEVLGSYTYSSLYTIQTSPLRLLALSRDVFRESKDRFRTWQQSSEDVVDSAQASLSKRWQRFYSIVKDSIRERSLSNIQRKILSPITLCRNEAKRKQDSLKRLRDMTASGLGVLVDEGLAFGADDEEKEVPTGTTTQAWKGVVERSVALMDMVLKDVCSLDTGVAEFEDKVFAGVEEDPELSIHVEDMNPMDKPAILARRLLNLLKTGIPDHVSATKALVKENGRPSLAVRYWLPAGLALLFSTTILRVLVSRKVEIIAWIRDLGSTIRDFWMNWVIDPMRKVVRTIRHDANSEIALMSRDSLRADRESLERMVVEFALDKPHFVVRGSSLSEAQIAELRAKVSAGDVTPVLRAYEKDLRSPLRGAITGDLVRSLLIQVQKTKVDLEVAISGIDALLRSQELVFGFVGLTPGILVSIGVFQYLRGIFGGRKGMRNSHLAGQSVRVLRNIDRIFVDATATSMPTTVLSYKDHGLLLCEVHVLRNLVHKLLPSNVEKEFLEDLEDLANIKGIQFQVRALERIRWAYSRWLK